MQNLIDAIATATKLYQSDDHFQAELICFQILDIQPDNSDALYLSG
jgi:hypothetical protein